MQSNENDPEDDGGPGVETETKLDVPEGFDDLSTEEQVEYVQSLWDRIARPDGDVPVPDWHQRIVEERLASRSPDDDTPWKEVKDRLTDRCDD